MERDVFFRHGHFFSSKKKRRQRPIYHGALRAHSNARRRGTRAQGERPGVYAFVADILSPPSPSVCLAVPGIAPSGVRGGAVCGSGRARNGARRASSPARAPACASLSCWPALDVAGEEGVCRCAGRARDRLRFASRAGSADPLCARRCPCARVCRPSARSRS